MATSKIKIGLFIREKGEFMELESFMVQIANKKRKRNGGFIFSPPVVCLTEKDEMDILCEFQRIGLRSNSKNFSEKKGFQTQGTSGEEAAQHPKSLSESIFSQKIASNMKANAKPTSISADESETFIDNDIGFIHIAPTCDQAKAVTKMLRKYYEGYMSLGLGTVLVVLFVSMLKAAKFS